MMLSVFFNELAKKKVQLLSLNAKLKVRIPKEAHSTEFLIEIQRHRPQILGVIPLSMANQWIKFTEGSNHPENVVNVAMSSESATGKALRDDDIYDDTLRDDDISPFVAPIVPLSDLDRMHQVGEVVFQEWDCEKIDRALHDGHAAPVWSHVLNEWMWWVLGEPQKKRLLGLYPDSSVYTLDEVKALINAKVTPEGLKRLCEAKEIFKGKFTEVPTNNIRKL